MRPSCRDCARKHLAQAVILMSESRQGYPGHYWLALGHLAEAGDELAADHPDLAAEVRRVRKSIEAAGPVDSGAVALAIMPLIDQVTGATSDRVHAPYQPASPVAQDKLILRAGDEPGKVADGRTIEQAVKDFQEARAHREASPPSSPKKCGGCEKAAQLRSALANSDMKGLPRRLVILTTLSNFRPGYSLATCVLEQAHAARLAGLRVHIIVMDNTQDVPELQDGITIERVFPAVHWRPDEPDDRQAQVVESRLRQVLTAYAPCDVISHDLLFQSWFVSAARAIHTIADSLTGVRWWHQAHSSVGARPADPVAASLRASLPRGHHRLLVLNQVDRRQFCAYYQVTPDSVDVLGNSRDPRPFHRMPEEAVRIVTATQMHLADVVQVYPLSATRLSAKGLDHVIRLFDAIKSMGKKVRLVVACAHANGKDALAGIQEAHKLADELGLGEDLVFTSELLPETKGEGLSADAVRALFQVSNVFAFPTTSEASPLVLMEAALSGCLLVLNSSLPCLMEHVPATGAMWVPWGSIKEHGQPVDNAAVAARVLGLLEGSHVNQAKRAILRQRCVETYGQALVQVLGHSTSDDSATGAPAP